MWTRSDAESNRRERAFGEDAWGGIFRKWTPPLPESLSPRFAELEIIELLGRGGMGAVYKARQKNLDRLVALKILPPEIAEDSTFTQRFEREAKALARLSHPHIVTIYDFGQRDGLFYFLMEYVDGPNLGRLLANGEISPQQALAIVPQICEALQYAHEQSVVHRDIKPENILVSHLGQVKVADFGIAKLLVPPAQTADPQSALTLTAGFVGTPNYVAPEQLEHPTDVDHRADIYSLGVVLYQMLTGELPVGHFELPSAKSPVDVRLDKVVLRAMEREPQRRYQQASQIKTEVETILRTPGPGAVLRDELAEAVPGRRVARAPKRTDRSVPLTLTIAAMLLLGVIVLAAQYANSVTPHEQHAATPPANSPEAIKTSDVAATPSPPSPSGAAPTTTTNLPRLVILPCDATLPDIDATLIDDVLSARLDATGVAAIVDRQRLNAVLAEQKLGLAELVRTDQAVKVGRLLGADLLLLTRAHKIGEKIYLSDKVISVQTGQIKGDVQSLDATAATDGVLDGLYRMIAAKLPGWVDQLADKSDDGSGSAPLMLRKAFADRKIPTIAIVIPEQIIRRPVIDPAVETEFKAALIDAGVQPVELTEQSRHALDPRMPLLTGRSQQVRPATANAEVEQLGQLAELFKGADYLIYGEAFCSEGDPIHGLRVATGRAEVRIIHLKTGKSVLIDRDQAAAPDLSVERAGKTALQKLGRTLAYRMLMQWAQQLPRNEGQP
ncbi:MAG: serine/threonine-protein kinase [Phycisphaerales bacterium]